jgi:hypothetical protein
MTRWTLIILHALLGVAAVGAGQAFVRDPTGTALGMSTRWLKPSPFRDFCIPGLFLVLVIGGTNLLSAFLLWQGHKRSAPVGLATGMLLVAWVGVQTVIIGFRHWSQGIWWATFSLVMVLAARLVRQGACQIAAQ